MKSLKERIAIEQVYANGGNIVWEELDSGKKADLIEANRDLAIFNWADYDYEIKPEPLEFWVNVYEEMDGEKVYCLHTSESSANSRRDSGITKTIKVREVLE